MKNAVRLLAVSGMLLAQSGALFAQEELGALPGGIYELWRRAVQDEDGWILPPKRNKKKVGEKKVTARYRKETREVPVYEYETKEILVRSNDDSGGAAGAMVKKTIKIRGKQKGTKQVTRLVSDPNGPISKQVTRAVYGPGGHDSWVLGRLGTNAMATAVLLQTEVPGIEEAMEPSIEKMVELVEGYGMPDFTWDLAWLIVLFSESSDQNAQALVPEMVEKLMRGQWTSGEANGLWGPLAIQPEYLGYLYAKFWEQSQEYQKVKAKVGDDTKPASIKKLNEATGALDAVKEELDAYTWFYRKADPSKYSATLEDEWEEKRGFRLPPQYPFQTQTADLESTWLALFAIRAAAEKDLIPLPKREPVMAGGLRKPPTPNPKQVMVRAGAGITKHQHSSGAFPEMNFHTTVSAFDSVPGIRGVPMRKGLQLPRLENPVTLISTAQGLAGLSIIGDVLGPSAYRQYGRSMLGAKKVLDQKIEEALSGESPHLGQNSLGWMALAMAVMDSGPEMEAAPKELRSLVREKVVSTYSPKKGWRPKGTRPLLSPVWVAQAKALPGRSKNQQEYPEPVVMRAWDQEDPGKFWKAFNNHSDRTNPEATTAAAIWVLSGGEPVTDAVPAPEPPPSEEEGGEELQ